MELHAVALLSFLLAPCGLASQLPKGPLRSSSLEAKVVSSGVRFSAVDPDIEADIYAAQETFASVNTTWDYIQELFSLANQTAVLSAKAAMAKLDMLAPLLDQVQSAADAIDSQPFAPGNTGGIIQDLVKDFMREVDANADVVREKLLDAEDVASAAIDIALETVRTAVDAVLLAFKDLLGKVIEATDTLDASATSAGASDSLLQEAANSSSLGARGWICRTSSKKSVWDAAMEAVDKANESLISFAEKIDGINDTLVEAVVAPFVSTTEGAMGDFVTTCNSAVLLLPNQMASAASDVCSAATDITDLFANDFDSFGGAAATKIVVARKLLGPVFHMIVSLADLVGKAQAACEMLNL